MADVSPGLQIIDFLYAHGYYHRFPDVAAWDAGLQIIDVSNPQNPALLGSYDTSSYAYSKTVAHREG